MAPEQKARRDIDGHLLKCGWDVQDADEIGISEGLGTVRDAAFGAGRTGTGPEAQDGAGDGRRSLRGVRDRRLNPMKNFQEKVGFIWSVADLLRGDYKQSEYGKVILPLTVLRRLDCVLEPAKEKEANLFAAELLMPQPMVHSTISTVDGMDLEDEQILNDLASRFAVSVQALAFRLAYLGYLEL
jgi:hypothetical protein